MKTTFYDMRDFVNTIQREVQCLECKVEQGGGTTENKESFPLPVFTTVEDQTVYTIAVPAGAELVSITVESNPMSIGTQATLSGTSLTLPSGLGAGQRVYVVYKV